MNDTKDLHKKYGLTNFDKLVADWYASFRVFHFPGSNLVRIPVNKLYNKLQSRYRYSVNLDRYVSEKLYNFPVGKYSYRFGQFWIKGINLASIGSFCSIARSVIITGMNHPLSNISTNPFLYYKSRGFIADNRKDLLEEDKNRKVVIGNDVWIGTQVIILPSVTIGNGAVIGAGTVVTKDVPPYCVFAGNPGKVIRMRFDEKQIEIIEQSRWWEWTDERIKKNIALFTDPEMFFKHFTDSGK